MEGLLLDDAVDGYLQRVARTRPWTKTPEETLLLAWSNGLHARAREPLVLTPHFRRLVELYAGDEQLSPEGSSALSRTLDHLFLGADPRL